MVESAGLSHDTSPALRDPLSWSTEAWEGLSTGGSLATAVAESALVVVAAALRSSCCCRAEARSAAGRGRVVRVRREVEGSERATEAAVREERVMAVSC